MKFALFAVLAASTQAHVIDGAKLDKAQDQFEAFADNTEAFLKNEFAPSFKVYVADLKKAEQEYQAANQVALKKLQTKLQAAKPKFDALKKEFKTYEKQAEATVTKEGHADIAKLEKMEADLEKKMHWAYILIVHWIIRKSFRSQFTLFT